MRAKINQLKKNPHAIAINRRIAKFNQRCARYHFVNSPPRKLLQYKKELEKAVMALNQHPDQYTLLYPIAEKLNKAEKHLAHLILTPPPPAINLPAANLLNLPVSHDDIPKLAAVGIFTLRLKSFINQLIGAAHTQPHASGVLLAIPIIGLLAAGVLPFYHAAHAYFKNQNFLKMMLHISTIAVVLIGVSVVGAGLATALASGLVALSIAITGSIPNFWLPLIKTIRTIHDLQTKLNLLDHINIHSDQPLSTQDKILVFTAYEQAKKTGLINTSRLKHLSKILAKPHVSFKDIDQQFPFLEKIIPNRLIEERAFLHKEIAKLTLLRNHQLIRVSNAFFAIVGLALICIPTPPTMIAGFALLLASSISGIITEFNLWDKATHFIQTLFNRKETPIDQPISPNNSHQKITDTLANAATTHSSKGNHKPPTLGFHLTEQNKKPSPGQSSTKPLSRPRSH